MEKDSGHALSELAVDGGVSNSDLTMQVSFLGFELLSQISPICRFKPI
jgi:glycerol kinase